MKLPKDIEDGLRKLAEKTGVEYNELEKALKDTYNTDKTVKTMGNEEFKIRYSFAVLERCVK